MDETGPMDLILVLGWNYQEGRLLFYLHLKLTGCEPRTSRYRCLERPCLRGGRAEQKDKWIPRTLFEALIQQVALVNFAIW